MAVANTTTAANNLTMQSEPLSNTSFPSNPSALSDLSYLAKHSVHVLFNNIATSLLQGIHPYLQKS